MDKTLKTQFIEHVNTLQGKEYLAYLIAYYTAPTVKGKKPSSLMTFNNNGKNLLSLWQKYKKEVSSFLGLEYFELKQEKSNVLVLFYKTAILEKYMKKNDNKDFLKRMGYLDGMTLKQRLEQLKRRFKKLCPHEIGVFLGIPLHDVEGFIKHRGKGCLMCRYWKVYHNPLQAELLFRIYDAARRNIACMILENKSLYPKYIQ